VSEKVNAPTNSIFVLHMARYKFYMMTMMNGITTTKEITCNHGESWQWAGEQL